MATGNFYGQFFDHLAQKRIDIDSDTHKAMLCTSSYTPNMATHAYKSDVTNEVSGTGYTATGQALTSVAWTYTVANSFGTSRANSTAYAAGAFVRPATGNGYLYQASTGGTTGGSIPTYPTTIGSTVTDGSVVWTCVGRAIWTFNCAGLLWTSSTITARYVVFYDSTPASDATRPLIAYIDLVTDFSSSSGNFTVTIDPVGVAYIIVL